MNPSDNLIEEILTEVDPAARPILLNRANSSGLLPHLVEQLVAKVDFYCRSDPAQSTTLAEVALMSADISGSPRLLGFANRAKGHSLRALGQHQEALPYYNRAVDHFKQAGMPNEEGRSYIGEIAALSELGDFTLCLKRGERVRRRLSQLDDTLNLAKLSHNLSSVYMRMGRYRSALRLQNRAIHLFESLDRKDLAYPPLLSRANTYEIINRFKEASRDYELGRNHFAEQGMEAWVAAIDLNIGYLRYRQGLYNEAVTILSGVRQTFETIEQPDKQAEAETFLAACYIALGLYQEALELYQQAGSTFARLNMKYDQVWTEIWRAEALIKMGDPQQAGQILETLREAIQDDIDLAEHVQILAIIRYFSAEALSKITSEPSLLAEARNLCRLARETFNKINLLDWYAQSLLLEADLSQQLQLWAEAAEAYQLASPALTRLGMPRLWYEYYYGAGRLKQALAGELENEARNLQIEAARQDYLKAVEQIETVRASLRPEEWRSAFMASGLGAYEALVAICLEDSDDPGRLEEAFSYVERSKSRSLLDLLRENLTPLNDENNPEQTRVNQRIEELRQELNWYYSQFHNQQTLRSDDETQRFVRSNLDQMAKKLEGIEKELANLLRHHKLNLQQSGGSPDIFNSNPAGLHSEIRQYLTSERSLLEYYILGNRILAFVVKQDGIRIYRDLCSLEQIEDLQQSLSFQANKFNLGRSYVERRMEILKQSFDGYLAEFYNLLVAPLLESLNGAAIILVPHGILHTLPFHAFYDGINYLSDRFEISYAPSTAVLLHCLKQPKRPLTKMLGIGVPDEQLKGVEAEVLGLARFFPDARLLTGPSASLGCLQENLEWSDILHIASHGVFRVDNPLFSRIMLADGWLSVHDVMQWRFSPALVTLSACQTGLTRPLGGDELLGLARGFLSVGTYSLVVSLWSVSDEVTTYLMHYFYEALSQGEGRAAALQGAMTRLRHEPRYAHPHYWAGFILIGQP